VKHLKQLLTLPAAERLKRRYDKFRAYGQFAEKQAATAEKAPPVDLGAPVLQAQSDT